MFYITEEDAAKFWQYLEAETNMLEKQADKLEAKVQERLKEDGYKDSFALQWQAVTDARRIAVRELRYQIENGISDARTRDGSPIAVASINSLIGKALRSSNSSTFSAANLVEDMADGIFREAVSAVFAYAFKAQGVEVAA